MLPSWCQIAAPTSNLPPKAAHYIFQQIFTPVSATQPSQTIFPHTPRNLRGLLRRQKQRLWEVSGVFLVTTTRKRRVGVHTSRSGWLQSLCPLLFTVLSPKADKRFPPISSSPHIFLSASLGQPDAGQPASHCGLPELMLSSSLCQRRQESMVFTNIARKKMLGIESHIHLLAGGACTSPLCTCFHAHKVGIIIFYFMRIRYKNIHNLNMSGF